MPTFQKIVPGGTATLYTATDQGGTPHAYTRGVNVIPAGPSVDPTQTIDLGVDDFIATVTGTADWKVQVFDDTSAAPASLVTVGTRAAPNGWSVTCNINASLRGSTLVDQSSFTVTAPATARVGEYSLYVTCDHTVSGNASGHYLIYGRTQTSFDFGVTYYSAIANAGFIVAAHWGTNVTTIDIFEHTSGPATQSAPLIVELLTPFNLPNWGSARNWLFFEASYSNASPPYRPDAADVAAGTATANVSLSYTTGQATFTLSYSVNPGPGIVTFTVKIESVQTTFSPIYLFDDGPVFVTVNIHPVSGGGGGGAAPSGTGFRHDATLRPSFLTAGSGGVRLLTTKDAAHSWDSYTVTSGAAADASLLIEPQTNSFLALFTNTPSGGAAAFYTSAAAADGEQGDWGASASLATLTGAYPVAVQHPADPTRVACLTLDSGVLKAWVSYDTGATWAALNASVATGLDFSASGRAGLCWLGERLCAVYASGSNLMAKVSADGGHTWPGTAVTVASAGPYSGVSGNSLLGTLYALANTASATKVFSSGDLGATWAATAADPAAQAAGVALGTVAETARLLIGTSLYSADNGATWTAD